MHGSTTKGSTLLRHVKQLLVSVTGQSPPGPSGDHVERAHDEARVTVTLRTSSEAESQERGESGTEPGNALGAGLPSLFPCYQGAGAKRPILAGYGRVRASREQSIVT